MHVHGIKARNTRKTLIQHVKGKQTIKQRNKDLKSIKRNKTEAYDVNEKKKQEQKTQIMVFGHEYACAYIGLCTQASCMRMHTSSCIRIQEACARKHTLKNPNLENKNTNIVEL